MSKLLSNTLSSNAYWTVNKAIAHHVGFNAAVLLDDLISKREYFTQRNELQPDGSFFNTAENIQDDLGIGKEARIAAQKSLISVGFIKVVKRGIPSKNYFLIQDDTIVTFLSNYSSPATGAPVVDNHDDNKSTNTTTSTLQTRPLIRIKNKSKVESETSLPLKEEKGSIDVILKHKDRREQWERLPTQIQSSIATIQDEDLMIASFKAAVSTYLTPKFELAEDDLDIIMSPSSAPVSVQVQQKQPQTVAQVASASQPTPNEIILAWRDQYGPITEFLGGSKANSSLADLVETFKVHSYAPSDISVKKVISTCFGLNPKKTGKLPEWIKETEERLKDAITRGFSTKVSISTSSNSGSLNFQSPEAKAKYEMLVANGITSAHLNGMSPFEYAHQRAHAESFKQLSNEEIEEREKSRAVNPESFDQ